MREVQSIVYDMNRFLDYIFAMPLKFSTRLPAKKETMSAPQPVGEIMSDEKC